MDLPIENGGSFHSYVNVYQRVHQCKSSMSIHVIYGMSSFPVTNSIIFQRAGEKTPDNFWEISGLVKYIVDLKMI